MSRKEEDYERLETINADLVEALEGIGDETANSLDSSRTSLTPVGALLVIKELVRKAIAQAKS